MSRMNNAEIKIEPKIILTSAMFNAANYSFPNVETYGGGNLTYYGSNLGAKITVNGWGYPISDPNYEASNIIFQTGNIWGGERFVHFKNESGTKLMSVGSTGRVGIGTLSSPITAVLHTVGTVRFESLPSGVGNVLVADANGNVFVSTTPASIVNSENSNVNSEANKKLADQISQQQEIINDLQARLNELEVNSVKNTSVEIKDVSKLSQNKPNPFNQNTSIDYYVADGANNAVLYIYNMQGQQIKKYVLEQKGKGTLVINGKDLEAGIYHYSLIIDGKLIDTKKMILTN